MAAGHNARVEASKQTELCRWAINENLLNHVHGGNTAIENVHTCEYFEAKLMCDGCDEADVIHRMAIAHTT